MTPEFEWDSKKAAANLKKHADPLARIIDDADHSNGEQRELIVGHSVDGRLLIVNFTEREARARIIGARKYEENAAKRTT